MNDRMLKLKSHLETNNLKAVAINPSPSLTYLTGLHLHVSERPSVFLYSLEAECPALVLPGLELGKTNNLDFECKVFPYGDHPGTWQQAFTDAGNFIGSTLPTIGIEPTHFRVLELRFVEAAFPKAQFISAESIFALLRMQKENKEISYMEQAARIAEEALLSTIKQIKLGMTEAEIAAELTVQLLRSGSEILAFPPIVASGPNSANPHSFPGDRMIQSGDLLLFDYGATTGGYCSDITRTYAVGKIDNELQTIYHIVREANAAARKTAKPGIPAGDVDQAARSVIKKAGYGDHFIHRTGHGLGMEVHEQPYIFEGNELILRPGMTFTIEPGIYLPDLGGVRIEDNVVITQDGLRSLTSLPRDFSTIL